MSVPPWIVTSESEAMITIILTPNLTVHCHFKSPIQPGLQTQVANLTHITALHDTVTLFGAKYF